MQSPALMFACVCSALHVCTREAPCSEMVCDAAGTFATHVVLWTARDVAVLVRKYAMLAMIWSTPPIPDSSATVALVFPGMCTAFTVSPPLCGLLCLAERHLGLIIIYLIVIA